MINIPREGRQSGDKGTDNVLFRLHEYFFFRFFASFTVMKVRIDAYCCKWLQIHSARGWYLCCTRHSQSYTKKTSHSLVGFNAETIAGNLGMEGSSKDGSRLQDQFCKPVL